MKLMRKSIKLVEDTTILSIVTKYYNSSREGLPSIASLFHFDSPEEPKMFLVSMRNKGRELSLPIMSPN